MTNHAGEMLAPIWPAGMIFFAGYSTMQQGNGFQNDMSKSLQNAVEIRISRINHDMEHPEIFNMLMRYSLDTLQYHDQEPKRNGFILFRFMFGDWVKTVRPWLIERQSHFELIRTYQVDVMEQLRKKRITVAEDDLEILFAINVMLENAGYDVVLSHCGRPLLTELKEVPDLIILDKLMPDVDGLEICRQLRSNANTKDVPVIMISAAHNFKIKALEGGVNECLEKPFQMQDLLRLVSKYTQADQSESLETNLRFI
jgi:CheY-like chemotaxis protein